MPPPACGASWLACPPAAMRTEASSKAAAPHAPGVVSASPMQLGPHADGNALPLGPSAPLDQRAAPPAVHALERSASSMLAAAPGCSGAGGAAAALPDLDQALLKDIAVPRPAGGAKQHDGEQPTDPTMAGFSDSHDHAVTAGQTRQHCGSGPGPVCDALHAASNIELDLPCWDDLDPELLDGLDFGPDVDGSDLDFDWAAQLGGASLPAGAEAQPGSMPRRETDGAGSCSMGGSMPSPDGPAPLLALQLQLPASQPPAAAAVGRDGVPAMPADAAPPHRHGQGLDLGRCSDEAMPVPGPRAGAYGSMAMQDGCMPCPMPPHAAYPSACPSAAFCACGSCQGWSGPQMQGAAWEPMQMQMQMMQAELGASMAAAHEQGWGGAMRYGMQPPMAPQGWRHMRARMPYRRPMGQPWLEPHSFSYGLAAGSAPWCFPEPAPGMVGAGLSPAEL